MVTPRQCRICLEVDNPQHMMSPCLCNGTSRYIHDYCIDQYIHYYPDRICRVCKEELKYTSVLDWALFYVMMGSYIVLLFLSSVELQFKFGLVCLGTILFVIYSHYGLFQRMFIVRMILLNTIFILLQGHVYTTIGFTAFATLYTLSRYIPLDTLIFATMILYGGLYMGFMAYVVAKDSDIYASALFVAILYLISNLFLNFHPPMRLANA
jgi:hypothetical protein